MSSTASRRVELGDGIAIDVGVLEGARPSSPGALPTIDLSNLPSARVVARLAEERGATSIKAICATAPADGWADGVEEILLARASQLARGAVLDDAPSAFETSEPHPLRGGFEQTFRASLQRGDVRLTLRGRHWLGFAGDPRSAYLCTAACIEPTSEGACAVVIDATGPSGAWLSPPPPNLVARLMLASATAPHTAVATLALVAASVVAIILARRPRPRP